MERYTYKGNNQKKIELFILGTYTIYCINMIFMSVEKNWGTFISLALMGCWALGCVTTVAKLKEYEFRAKLMVCVIQISVIIYAINIGEIERVLPIFITFVVATGLYGMENLICTTIISATFIFLYYCLILKIFDNNSLDDNVAIMLQLLNIYFVEFLVYMYTKRNREGSKQLLGTIDKLKELQNSKDDFLANVSHEIRTPINTIYGLSEVILSEDLPEKVKKDILGIQQAGRNLTSAVSDIMDFSELQTGNIELEEESYNIASTINDVINMTLAKKNEKNIELIVDCDANIPCALLGDEKKLRRIIMNFVDNAIKFTEQGFVSIVVGYRKETYGINLVVSVKDTGIGMDPKSLEKLFDSFNQVDTSRKRQEGGLGLGLAISYALAKKMGAAITVKSRPGRGTIIKVVVPQKVLDETPIAYIDDRANVNVGTYIDMEQFDMVEIRDEYSKNIIHMVEQLNGRCHICRNLAELQRRFEKEHFSHVFISDNEYIKDKTYFDNLAKKTKLIMVLDYEDDNKVDNPEIYKIYKPYYILSIVAALNGINRTAKSDKEIVSKKFTTKGAHVLVVDDNKMNLRVVEGFLSDYKIKVTTALSGKEALSKIETKDYDFVFMDHMMPEMDGVETLHNIRSKGGSYYQKVPVVALTANAVAGSREQLIKQGFDDFIEKPVERSVFERVLKRNIPEEKIIYYTDGDDVDRDIIEEKEITMEVLENTLIPKGIDVSKGILYCNGMERFVDLLRSYCEESNELKVQVKELFANKDWKNYTIAVHGMKSSMRSIGAMEISQLAANLEKAGLDRNIDYIMDNHEELIRRYEMLFSELSEYEWLVKKSEEIVDEEIVALDEELEVIDDSVFDAIISDMEDATYSLNGAELMELVIKLQGYKFNDNSLKEALIPVVRKIEMSDYVSAFEAVVKIKQKMSGKEAE